MKFLETERQVFMVDIETTGTDPIEDDILQIGILELNRDREGYWQHGNKYIRTLYTSKTSFNEFVHNHHRELLEQCRQTKPHTPEEVRQSLITFFTTCNACSMPQLMGLNLGMLDIPFLIAKKFLKAPMASVTNMLVGDFHYRIYELRGAYSLAEDVLGVSSKLLMSMAQDAYPEGPLPEGKKHEALYDCYNQVKTLNGIIRLMKRGMVPNLMKGN